MRYFSKDEWLEEIDEENNNDIESNNHLEVNPSHDDSESHDSESEGAPTFSAPRTLPPEHLNEPTSIPVDVTKKGKLLLYYCYIKRFSL